MIFFGYVICVIYDFFFESPTILFFIYGSRQQAKFLLSNINKYSILESI